MILIKNMDMPSKCRDCAFCVDQTTNDYGSFGECLLQKRKPVYCLSWSRDDGCPLQESEEE